MKLLSKADASKRIAKENLDLLEYNVRLKKAVRENLSRFNSMKDEYGSEKKGAFADYERFCSSLNQKKSKLLKELTDLEKEIELKKDIYYGLVEKQDLLEEKMYELKERESKLFLREQFVLKVEQNLPK